MASYLSPEGLFALIFAGTCLFVVARRAKRHGALLPIDYSILFMAMIYGLSWPLVIASIMDGNAQNIHVYSKFQNILFLNTLAAAMAAAGLLIGWKLVIRKPHRYLPNSDGLLSSIRNPATYSAAFWVMLAVAAGSQILYTMDYGGLFGAFKYSNYIRAGLSEYFVRSRFSFLAPFGELALLACYGFWGLILSGNGRMNAKIGFIASMIASLYVLYLSQGRLNVVVFFAILAMSTTLLRSRGTSYTPVIAILAVPISVYATYEISKYFNVKSESSFIAFYTKEISFVFAGFFAQLSNPSNLYRFFYDIATYPAYLIPSSMTINWLSDPSDLNTMLIHGARKGQHGITSGMPVDIVTMGLIQMNFAGIIPYAIFYGAILAAAHRICMSIALRGLRAVFYAYICIKIAGLGLFYAQPATVVVGNFALIVALFFAIFLTWGRQVRASDRGGFA